MIIKEDNFAYWVEAKDGIGDTYYYCSKCGVSNRPVHQYCPCCKRFMPNVVKEEKK